MSYCVILEFYLRINVHLTIAYIIAVAYYSATNASNDNVRFYVDGQVYTYLYNNFIFKNNYYPI